MTSFKAGDIVNYTTLNDKPLVCIVQKPFATTPKGYTVLKMTITPYTVFAIDASAVASRVKLVPTPPRTPPSPPPGPTPPGPSPGPSPGGPTPLWPTPSLPKSPKWPKPPKTPSGPGFWDRLKNSGSTIDDSYGLGTVLLFLGALILQSVDYWTGYQRPGFMIYFLPFILVLYFFFNSMQFDRNFITFTTVLVFAYVLPIIANSLPESWMSLLVNGLFFYLPVIVLYLGLKAPKGTLPWVLTIIILIIFVTAAIFSVIESFAPDMNTKKMLKDPMAGLKYATSSVLKVFSKAMTSITNAFNRAVAQATGEPYDGDQESRVGIYVEDVRGIESRYTNMSNVFVEAKISAENLKESVDVNTICYIDNVGPGLASPTMIYNVTDNYENIVDCNFGRLAVGIYDVKVRINFQFETTSDIKYTFVNSGLKSDQYERLNIDPNTIATYTGGPVELGLPSLSQPLRVDVIPGRNTQLSTYPFGVSLRNIWPQGKIIRGIRYMLDVPSEITLIDCSRNFTTESGQNASNGRNIYYFEVDTENARDKFDAIQCRMDINNVNSLLGGDLKSERTFAARVRYEYAVEGSTTIVVEQN